MTTRRDFLAAGTAVALVPVAAGAATPSPQPALNFELAAFSALLERDVPHKHLFASVKADRGEVFSAMRNTLKAYPESGTPMSQVHPVAVLYHGASIALAFNDDIWDRYFIPLAKDKAQATEPAVKDLLTMLDAKTHGNPCMKRQGGEWDASIPSLIADSNANFFVCNNAAHGFAGIIADAMKVKSSDVYQALTRNLVPNAMLVPAGVWAVHAIQEHRYTLLQTSL